jgi:hypothetical protein
MSPGAAQNWMAATRIDVGRMMNVMANEVVEKVFS